MAKGIIVTHGNLGQELIATAQSIFGAADDIVAISNQGTTPESLAALLREGIDGAAGDDVVVMVDFFGGSCCHACLKVEQEYDNVHLVAGVNLPMVLAFLYKRDGALAVDLLVDIVKRAQSSIQVVNPETL